MPPAPDMGCRPHGMVGCLACWARIIQATTGGSGGQVREG